MRLLLILFFSFTVAQGQSLEVFLRALETHPGVQASAALIGAAQAQLDAVYTPVGFEMSGNYTRLNLDLPEPPPEQESPDIPENLVGLNLSASFRPFVFGDLSDLAEQRRLELYRAQLSYRETLSNLQTQALESLGSLRLAQTSVALAQEGVSLAETVLETTQTRLIRGAASDADLRGAQQRLREAQNNLLNAEANAEIVEQGLRNLVGDIALPESVMPELFAGTLKTSPPDVARAQLDLTLAKVGVTNAERAFYPTAQASYTWPLEDEKSELSLSIESRTLQPRIGYSYANPKQSTAGFSAPEGVPSTALKGSFTVGVSVNVSPENVGALQAAQARVSASEAGLKAAQDSADLNRLSLDNAFENAVRNEAFAELSLRDAERNLEDAETRVELGLATDLDLLQATFALNQSKLNLLSAQQSLLQARLSYFRSYAVPPSEALK